MAITRASPLHAWCYPGGNPGTGWHSAWRKPQSVTELSEIYPLLTCFSVIPLQPCSLQSDGSEVLLSPEVTCGPPDMIVTTPFALTIPHCADVSSEHWNIHLKKRTQQGKWEVRPCSSFSKSRLWVPSVEWAVPYSLLTQVSCVICEHVLVF